MKQKEIVLILGSLLILVVAWISFSVYHNSVTSTTPLSLENTVKPINRNFDESTIEKLQERIEISPTYEFDNLGTIEEIPTNTPAVTNIASESSDLTQINENLSSTNGGQLEP